MTDHVEPGGEEPAPPEPGEAPPPPEPAHQPTPPGDHLGALAERVSPLSDAHDHARGALSRAEEDLRALEREVATARSAAEDAEQAHARALAASYRDQSEGAGSALEGSTRTLEDARARLRDAEARERQAARAVELLREELAASRTRLHEGATAAKAEAAAAVLEDARGSWATVWAHLQQLKAIRSIPYGVDPPVVDEVDPAAEDFARRVLEGRGPAGRGRPAGLWSVVARFLLTLLGAAGILLGTFLAWIRPGDATGMDLDHGVFFRIESLSALAPSTLLAGAITLAIGGLAVLGLALRSGWLTRIAGSLGLLAFILYTITVFRSPEARFPAAVGLGMWMILAGSVVVLAAGFVGRRRGRTRT